MPRPPSNLKKHTLNLFEGDFDRLQTLYPEVGAGVIIRNVIHKFLRNLEAGTETAPLELEVDI